MANENTVEAVFAGKDPQIFNLYKQFIEVVNPLGEFCISVKSNIIYLKKSYNFASIQPRKNYFYLEFLRAYPLENPRIVRYLQLSARRYAYTVKIERTSDIDEELLKWLKDAYTLNK